jgi:O-methyltransferase involved in polyketide biosynthesis
MARDFSSISASARWLLLAKAHSGLPYAREVAELVFGHDAVGAAAISTSPAAAIRRRHFELRARSVDEALDIGPATRIVEFAAGLSFRGLTRAVRDDVHYLDTDLPDLVKLKRRLLTPRWTPKTGH